LKSTAAAVVAAEKSWKNSWFAGDFGCVFMLQRLLWQQVAACFVDLPAVLF
jgi:hypothetical protein